MKNQHPRQKHSVPPRPPHPQRRREPLPWCEPKSAHEDETAPQRVQAIMRHASYLQADQDIDFLNLDETRGVRLQIDYQKAELLLQQHGIEHTIVVFGSTRIKEPAAAQRVVDNLRIQLDEHPDDTELGRQLLVAERILAKSCYYDVARAFGRLVSEAGRRIGDGQLVIMTGGGPGNSTTLLSIDLVKIALGQFDLGPAAAMSLIYFAITLLVSWLFYTLMTKDDGK